MQSCKQLVVSEEPEKVDPSIVGKEVSNPLILKIRMKTMVKFSVFQIPVSSSAYDSSGSFDITF